MIIGVSCIKEAIAGVLREAKQSGEGTLNRREVRDRAGIPFAISDGFDAGSWNACDYFLNMMEPRGEVVNDNPGSGQDRWRLAD